MGYPMKRETKIRLIFLYYEILCRSTTWDSLIIVVPGLGASLVDDAGNQLITLLRYAIYSSS